MGRDAKPWYRKSKRSYYVWHEGNQVRLSGDKEEAYRQWHAILSSGKDSPPGGGSVIVSDLVKAYLADITPKLKPKTITTKREFLDRLVKERGKRTFDESVREWIAKPTWGRSRRWLASCILKAMSRWGVEEGKLLEVDPLKGWKVPGPKSRGEDALIPPEAHARILEEALPTLRPLLAFLHATGCRPGEAVGLTAAQVSIERKLAVVEDHKTEGKTAKPRLILLPDAILPVLAPLLEKHKTGCLFRNRRGNPFKVNDLGTWMNRACKRLKLPPYTPYGYRHTLATDALAKGIPDAHVAALLGHSSTAMLHRHYSHLLGRLDVLRQAADRARPME